jgi:flagellar hook assembly protein FlgD
MNSNFPSNEIWKFVNSDYVFGNPQQPFPYENSRSYSSAANLTDQNFVAIKLGDVNNSWNPNTSKSQIASTLNFDLADQNAIAGDIISIPVKVSNFNNISGYQFTINWNPNDFEFVGIDNNALTGNYGTNQVSSGKITALWSTENTNGQILADGSIVFTLKLKVINQANANTPIEINSSITAAEAYNSNLDQLTIVTTSANITINNTTSISDIQKDNYYLLQNSPNPFSENTVIIFNLPENQKVSLVIYNLLGEEVYNFSDNYSKGTHNLIWNGKNQHNKALSNGNYLLKMQAGDFIANRKLILIR